MIRQVCDLRRRSDLSIGKGMRLGEKMSIVRKRPRYAERISNVLREIQPARRQNRFWAVRGFQDARSGSENAALCSSVRERDIHDKFSFETGISSPNSIVNGKTTQIDLLRNQLQDKKENWRAR